MYAYESRQLACDISWDKATFLSQFEFGFYGDLQDLLLTMLHPTTLNQAIMQVVCCDNQLFEH